MQNKLFLKAADICELLEVKQTSAYEIIGNLWLFRDSQSHLSGLWEPPCRRMGAIYSGNSEPPYWTLLHIFPLYCKYTPLVWIQIKEVVNYDQVSWNPTLEKLRIQWEEHRTKLRCIQKHSRQGFEKSSGNQSFMAAGFWHDRQCARGADVS